MLEGGQQLLWTRVQRAISAHVEKVMMPVDLQGMKRSSWVWGERAGEAERSERETAAL
jgi:hypothetical protein